MSGATVVAGAATLVVSANRPPLHDGWVLIESGIVRSVGSGPPPPADTVVEAGHAVVVPGLVCAHHHPSQGTSRGVPTPPGLLGWLEEHYRRWARLRAGDVTAAARLSFAQLLIGGCTTVAAFEYLHPAGEDFVSPVVDAAADLGIRLRYVRGTAPTLEADLADRLVRRDVDVSRLVEPPQRGLAAMDATVRRPSSPELRWACGPTTPVLGDDGEFHRAVADVAASAGTAVHVHFHPIAGRRPAESGYDLARRLGLVRRGNWFAHGSRLTTSDVAALGAAGVGVVHCPSTSLRLGYELPPLAEWRASSDRIAVAVDGAASNDRGAMLREAQLAWYTQGQPHLAAAGNITPHQILDLVTASAARTIGWEGVGSLEEGAHGDVAVFDLSGLDGAGAAGGAAGDDLFRLFATGDGIRARHVLVGGRPVVVDGRLVTGDEREIVDAANESAGYLSEVEPVPSGR